MDRENQLLSREEWPTERTPMAPKKTKSRTGGWGDGIYTKTCFCGLSLKSILRTLVVLGILAEFVSQIVYAVGPKAVRPYTFVTEFLIGGVFTVDTFLRMILVKNFFFHKPLYNRKDTPSRWALHIRPNLVSVFDILSGPVGLAVDIVTFVYTRNDTGIGKINGLGTTLRSTRIFSLGVVQDIFLRMLMVLPEIGASLLGAFVIIFFFGYFAHYAYGDEYPEYFGNMFAAIFTLFQLMTLDEWAKDVVRPVSDQYPAAHVFFITYMLISGFLVIHVFTGIVISGLLVGQEGTFDDKDVMEVLGYSRRGCEEKAMMDEPVVQIRALSKYLQTSKLQYANSHAGLEAKIFKLKRDLQQRDGMPDSVIDDSWLMTKMGKSPRPRSTSPHVFETK